MYVTRGNRTERKIRLAIDILNVIIGIAVTGLALITFLNTKDNMYLFPAIFLLGGSMELLTGIKFFLTDKKLQGFVMEGLAAVIYLIAIASHIAIGG